MLALGLSADGARGPRAASSGGPCTDDSTTERAPVGATTFRALLEEIAAGWNAGDAARAVAFDSLSQVGFGEYTFRFKGYQAHGVVVARLTGGLIQNWKEYELASPLGWEAFSGPNLF
jgi:hypothetical protein